jgi:signal transduction histidine kinase
LFTALSLFARLALSNVLQKSSAFLMFYPAVLASAWFGGLGGGLLATALALFIGVKFFMLPNHSLDTLSSQGGVGLLVFTGVSLTFSYLVESTQRARNRTRELLVAAQSVARERATLYDAEKQSREQLERALVQLDLLQALTAALSEAATPVQVAEALVQRMLTMGSAELCVFYAFDARAQRLVVLAHAGAEPSFSPPITRVDVASDAGDPLRKFLRARKPMWIEDRVRYRELFAREPMAPYGFDPNAFVLLPLDAPGGQLHGILVLAYRASRAFGSEFRQLLTVVTRQAAQAVDRSRLFDAEHRTRERVSRLAEVAQVVNAQLDRDATLGALGRWLVANVADWCAIQAPNEPPLVFRTGGAEEPAGETVDARAALERLLAGGPSELHPPHLSRTDMNDETIAAPASLVPPAPGGLTTSIAVPLTSRGRLLAVLVVGRIGGETLYDSDDLHMFEQLASRAAVAAENATLFQEARAAVRYRDEFLSIASHELNTPLTPLRLQLESALRGVAEERLRGKLTLSVKQVDRISKLVGELLDVSRITSGKLHLREESVDLAELLREVTDAHQGELARAGCELRVVMGGPVTGTWDRLRLSQVVANLLSNAAKYGAGQPVDVALSSPAEETAILTVADRGIGIAAKDHERIFERFERAASARNYGGFGLGLFIAKQIVEASGGQVRANLREGGGTVFTVTLPRRSQAAA